MGEYRSSFYNNTKLQTNFFVYQLIQTFLESLALLLSFVDPRISLILSLRFIHLVILIKATPYKDGLIRALLNDVITLAVMLAVLWFSYI